MALRPSNTVVLPLDRTPHSSNACLVAWIEKQYSRDWNGTARRWIDVYLLKKKIVEPLYPERLN